MRLILLLVFFITACNNSKQETEQVSADSSKSTLHTVSGDTTKESKMFWSDRLNGQKYLLPDSINSRPISFYINNPKVASIAKALYKGQFRPTDNDSTTQLLSYVTTEDNTIRPFYRWCLDFTMVISDGALGEYPGSPALKYATKFPKEFFDYMDKDVSGKRYKQWTEIIGYSGLPDYNKNASDIEKEVIHKMYANCFKCNGNIKNRITTFAKDIIEAVKLQD